MGIRKTYKQSANRFRMRARSLPIRYKLLISLLSVFFFFVFFELGLRTAAYLYVFYRVHDGIPLGGPYEQEDPLLKKKFTGASSRIVLCVGDSFTVGSRCPREGTYTAQLGARLEKSNPGERFTVVNKGICEATTSVSKGHLPLWIDKYDPELIILLVGSANRFNPVDYELWARRDIVSMIMSSFSHLRTVQLFRVLWINWSWHSLFQTVYPGFHRSFVWDLHLLRWKNIAQAPAEDDPLHRMWNLYNRGEIEKAVQIGQATLSDMGDGDADILCSLVHFYVEAGDLEKAESLLNGPLAGLPESGRLRNCQTYYYARLCGGYFSTKNNRPDKMMEYCLKAIELDPYEFMTYYGITKAYDLQSRYDSETIYRRLMNVGEENPGLMDFKWFKDYLALYRDKQSWEAGVGQWIYEDLEEIVRICKEHDVKLVIQNYPVDYPLANSVLKELALKHALPFVDNLSVFQRMEQKEEYFFDDDHCTPAGHCVMVDNIMSVLESQGWLTSATRDPS